MADQNWMSFFSDDEKAEIQELAATDIDYPKLPHDMEQFLKDIPNTNNLSNIYNHLEGRPLDPDTDAPLIFLKFNLQSAILLIKDNYFPIKSNTSERGICLNV